MANAIAGQPIPSGPLRAPRTRAGTWTVVALAAVLCAGLTPSVKGQGTGPIQDRAASAWDPGRYIDINEIRPGMEGYCLTCYSGAQPERFGVRVVSIVRNIEPGLDTILVMGTDERFIRTGPVSGCSGSPVYLDGRMAGALALGWSYSKDPLYGVTPIRQMLQVGHSDARTGVSGGTPLKVDYSQPIDLTRVQTQLRPARLDPQDRTTGQGPVPCILAVSGLPQAACEQTVAWLESMGLTATLSVGGQDHTGGEADKVALAPGAPMMVPLVDGDIRMAVLGTVTEVDGDRVYGFGHAFLGYGPVDLPLATARVHTVVSRTTQSLKLGSVVEVVGALTQDEPRGVVGHIGRQAKTLPLRVEVNHFTQARSRTFQCRLACHKALTPDLVRSVLTGAGLAFGDLPPDHTITYTGTVETDAGRVFRFTNVSSGETLSDLVSDGAGVAALLLNNPFKEIAIRNIQISMDVSGDNRVSSLDGLEVADRKVKPGDELVVGVVVESYPAVRRRVEFRIPVPEDLEPGEYTLTVCGPSEYLQFLRRLAPYRFVARDTDSLMEALEVLLSLRRDRLYCLLELPTRGLAVEQHELPDLPATKALVLESRNQTTAVRPLQPWVERSLSVDTIPQDRETLKIRVEKP